MFKKCFEIDQQQSCLRLEVASAKNKTTENPFRWSDMSTSYEVWTLLLWSCVVLRHTYWTWLFCRVIVASCVFF